LLSPTPPTSAISTRSLPDALPISILSDEAHLRHRRPRRPEQRGVGAELVPHAQWHRTIQVDTLGELEGADLRAERGLLSTAAGKDRKRTRLNSSHQIISYAVFCSK